MSPLEKEIKLNLVLNLQESCGFLALRFESCAPLIRWSKAIFPLYFCPPFHSLINPLEHIVLIIQANASKREMPDAIFIKI